ncbi:phosphorylcholine transferase LicD [Erysipelothrix urinaevulpis]|uniref:LicD family protein n=1 Tax=Erysipelothrix urinaevulpis TaxID=2683717 RepID=UPI00135B9392|nr:LicD family protein [Erysipelothrix urinaevulpis]
MTELDKLHTVHLELADELHRICLENNIEYFLIAGTLLGAVRHKGFIPWDDDFDIGLKRTEYNRLLEVLKFDLNSKYYTMTMSNNERFSLPFLKLMKKDTLLGEANLPDDIDDYGIFIDVFPFDVVPENEKDYKKHKRKTEFYKKMLLIKNNYKLNLHSMSRKIIYYILKTFSLFLSNANLKKKLEIQCTLYESPTSNKRTNLGGAYGYDHETISTNYFNELELYDFEGRKYYSFKDYDGYLTQFYGDYMQLPPKEERGDRHNYKYIVFDKKEV